jgi:intein/homing endonuclease
MPDGRKNHLPLSVLYTGAVKDLSGYAEAARGYIRSLDTVGVDLSVDARTFELQSRRLVEEVVERKMWEMMGKHPNAPIHIIHLTPDNYSDYSNNGKYRIGYYAWETSRLPPAWVKPINEVCREVWVPCQYLADISIDSGVQVPVKVLPHVVPVPSSSFEPFSTVAGLPDDKFKFYSIMQWSGRKNAQNMLLSYYLEFDRTDPVVFVLKTYRVGNARTERDYIRREISRLKRATKGPNCPPVLLIEEFLSSRDIDDLHHYCDCYVSMARSEGFCLTPDTLVDTINGVSKVDRISCGDKVFSHLGNLKEVTGTTSRQYSGEIIHIRPYGNNVGFSGTPEHPHLVLKRCKSKSFTGTLLEKEEISPQWISLKDIRKGDYLVVPKIDRNLIPCIRSLDTINYLDHSLSWIDNGNAISSVHSFCQRDKGPSLKDIADKCGCSFQTVSWALKNPKQSSSLMQRIRQKVKEIGYKVPSPIFFPKSICLSEGVGEFFGLYIAEGSANNGFIEFASHAEEEWARVVTEFVSEQVFGAKVSIRSKRKGNGISLTATGHFLSNFMKNLFGNSSLSKRIPPVLWNSPCIVGLIRGMFYGDGTQTNSISYSTNSLLLLHDLRCVLLMHGILSRIESRERPGRNIEHTLCIPKSFEKRFCNVFSPLKYSSTLSPARSESRSSLLEDNLAFYIPVKEVTSKYYSGMVYNLHVDGDRSYTISGIATHNCIPAFASAAVGNPIIVPRYSAFPEYFSDDTAYLVDVPAEVRIEDMKHISILYTGDMVWGDPSVDSCRAHMRHVFENRDIAKQKGLRAREYIKEHLSYEAIGRMMRGWLEPAQKEILGL